MAGGITLLAAMTLVMPIATIVPIHGLVQLTSNLSRSFILFKDINQRITLFFYVGIPIGGYLAYELLANIQEPTWALVLIAVILLYVVFKPKRLPHIMLPMFGFAILGGVAALLGCLVGATGPLLAAFFVRDDLSKEAMVATKAACQIGVHLVKIPIFIGLSFNYFEHWELIVSMALAVVAGTKVGTMFLRRVSPVFFMRLIKIIMFLIAVRLWVKFLGN